MVKEGSVLTERYGRESLTATPPMLDQAIEPVLDPLAAARAASLRDVSDAMPGMLALLRRPLGQAPGRA